MSVRSETYAPTATNDAGSAGIVCKLWGGSMIHSTVGAGGASTPRHQPSSISYEKPWWQLGSMGMGSIIHSTVVAGGASTPRHQPSSISHRKLQCQLGSMGWTGRGKRFKKCERGFTEARRRHSFRLQWRRGQFLKFWGLLFNLWVLLKFMISGVVVFRIQRFCRRVV